MADNTQHLDVQLDVEPATGVAYDATCELKEQFDALADQSVDPHTESIVAYQRERILASLIDLHTPWIRMCSRLYSSTRPDLFGDMVQAATEAALKAFLTWDPNKSRFLTWASKEVRKALIGEAFSAERPSLRRWNYEQVRQVRAYRETHPDATNVDIVAVTGVTAALLSRIDTHVLYSPDMSEAELCTPSRPFDALAETMDVRDATHRLVTLLGQLPPDQAEVTRLTYVMGMSQKDIADTLGVHRETIRRRHERAVATLRADPLLQRLVVD